MEKIGNGIYIENAYSGVTLGGLIQPFGTIFIDAPLRAEEGRMWRATLNGLGGSSSNRLLVNLDAHPDRTLGARIMECTILAHQKTAQVFRSRPSVFKGQNADSGSEWETYDEAVGTRWAVPDITFSQRIALHWGGPDIILEHHAGPTPGAIWVAIPDARILFVGDCVLADQPPFLANADIPTWLESLNAIEASYLGFTIISGRGGAIPFGAVEKLRSQLTLIQSELERMANRETLEATEILIPMVLSNLNQQSGTQPGFEDQYAQRLRHGLAQYFMRHYRPTESNTIQD
jgi:glyoxylase-like metal-dependent hydrolase (beta-lactamase superfamily II)